MTNIQIEYRDPRKLTEYKNNARTHSPHQVQTIAASIQEFGFVNPCLIDGKGGLIAGHGRREAALLLNLKEVPCIVVDYLSERQRQALILADNKIALQGGWDLEKLSDELSALSSAGFDLELTGFDEQELDALLRDDASILPEDFNQPEQIKVESHTRVQSQEGQTEDNDIPEVAREIRSKTGDVWLLGKHRVMCGDSTKAEDVARLMNGKEATMIHADPPYGMGKEKEGVANDNLYREKLDHFQMEWWTTFRAHMVSNASAYIWGNAEDLWRLWYVGGLKDTEYLELRNEIVWDKKSIAGMASDLMTAYPIASERCLFFQFGKQFLGNINTEDFPETWEPLRSYFESQAEGAGIKPADIKRVCGCSMYSHWFTKSQYTFMPAKHYQKLAAEYSGFFERDWAEMKQEWDRVKGRARDVISGKLEGVRSYFDNGHDIMRDVWEFPRVSGEERHGHATPKPVAMAERVIVSSSQPQDVIVEPFGGSAPTLIAAEKLQRSCFVMELTPSWVDVIVRRWQNFTGKEAVNEATGEAFGQ